MFLFYVILIVLSLYEIAIYLSYHRWYALQRRGLGLGNGKERVESTNWVLVKRSDIEKSPHSLLFDEETQTYELNVVVRL